MAYLRELMAGKLGLNAFEALLLVALAQPDSDEHQLWLVVVLDSVLDERNVLSESEVDDRLFVRA